MLLDGAAELGEALDRGRADLAGLAIDRQLAAEIRVKAMRRGGCAPATAAANDCAGAS